MKIELDAAALAGELAIVGKVIDKRTTMPVVGHVLMRAEGDRLILSATDLTVAFRTAIKADVKEPGTALVSAEILSRLVQALDGTVEIASAKDNWFELRCAGSKTKLPGLAPEDFPTMPAVPEKGHVIPGPGLVTVLRRTTFIARSEASKTKHGFHYVRLSIGKGEMSICATDGHRLAHAAVPAPEAKTAIVALVPSKTALLLIDLESRLKEQVSFHADESRVFFWVGDTILSSLVPTGHFPQIEKVLAVPTGYTELDLARGDVLAAIRRLAIVEPGGSLRCEVTKGTMVLASESDRGHGNEEIVTDSKVTAAPIGLGLDYVMDFLANAEGESVTMAQGDSEKACHFWPKGKAAEHHYVLSPRQL